MTYDRTTIVVHWLTVLLIAVLWGLAQIIDVWPPGSMGRVEVRSIHISLGIVLLVVLIYRLIWRHTGGRQLPPAETGVMHLLAVLAQFALYGLLAVILVSGVANAWVRGDNVFGLFSIPSFAPGDRAMRSLVGDIHDISVNLILFIAALHAAAALFHHYVKRDGVLRRMLPG
jgi:cytochrome b561